jgi:hypothetical protein
MTEEDVRMFREMAEAEMPGEWDLFGGYAPQVAWLCRRVMELEAERQTEVTT